MKGQSCQTQDFLLEESPLEIKQRYVSLGPGMTQLPGRVMRTPVRTVCFSAWFLMGTGLMQSHCLCVCVYILLPSPITFGLIAQFQQRGRGSRAAAGPAGILKSVEESEATGVHCRKSLCGSAGRAGQSCCCCSLFDTDTLTGEPLISCFASFSVKQGEFERFC